VSELFINETSYQRSVQLCVSIGIRCHQHIYYKVLDVELKCFDATSSNSYGSQGLFSEC
jgi:hypothetical protein